MINPPPAPPPKAKEPISISDKTSNSSVPSVPALTPATNSDYGFGSENRTHSSNNFHSTQSTPMSYDSGFSYGSQFYQNNNGLSSWEHQTANNLTWDAQQQQWIESSSHEELQKSPIRESLDSRIEYLLKQQSAGLAPSFLGELSGLGLGSPSFMSRDFKQNSSPFNYHKHRNYYDKNNDSDAILGTPPSPFLSASNYIKWHKATKDIDSGKIPSFDSDDDVETNNKEENDENEYEEDEEDDATPVKDEPRQSKKKKNRVPKGTEEDDDRMSLSSLSSGEKLQVGDTSEPLPSVMMQHPMYPSEHVQMMARLGLWKPGMGSDVGGAFPPTTQTDFASAPGTVPFPPFPIFPPNMSQAHPGQNFNSSSGTNVRPPFPPPQFFPGFIPQFPSVTPHHLQQTKITNDCLSSELSKKAKETRKVELSRNVIQKLVNELKDLMKKDICKKVVESSAFKGFENWWDENEKSSKANRGIVKNEQERKFTNINRHYNRDETTRWSILSSLYDNKNEPVQTYNNYGYGLGLRAAMPKMPSFRRKLKKSPSNLDEEGIDKREDSEAEPDKLGEDSDADIQNKRKSRQKNRAAAVIEKEKLSSESDSSSEDESSSSSSDDSSSSDSGSESESSSTSSSSESRSDSSTTSSSSSESSTSESSSSSASSSSSKKKKYVKHKQKDDRKKINNKMLYSSDESDNEKPAKAKIFDNESQESDISKDQTERVNDDDVSEMKDLEHEATEALMALASGFSSVHSKSDLYDKSKAQTKKDFDEEEGSDTESAPETEQYDSDKQQTSIAFDHSYCLPSSGKSAIDSVIDSVARGVSKNKKDSSMSSSDHVYSKVESLPQTKTQKRQYKRKIQQPKSPSQDIIPPIYAVASEWRKAKRVSSNVAATFSDFEQERTPSPRPVYKKRDLIEEMNILYEFLKIGIDSEDVQYLKRSYEAMLQDDNQIWWLNDIHWVDHPATNVSSPKKRRKTDDVQARVHVTGCARSEGYYKMDIYEKYKLSHVTNAPTNEDKDNDAPKQLRARQTTTQQSTREARSNQRRLLASVDAAWSDLLKFNQLQVCFY